MTWALHCNIKFLSDFKVSELESIFVFAFHSIECSSLGTLYLVFELLLLSSLGTSAGRRSRPPDSTPCIMGLVLFKCSGEHGFSIRSGTLIKAGAGTLIGAVGGAGFTGDSGVSGSVFLGDGVFLVAAG